MEKVRLTRKAMLARFINESNGYGMKTGKEYLLSVAYLLDSGNIQVFIEDKTDEMLFIDYVAQEDFDEEWEILKVMPFKELEKAFALLHSETQLR